MPSVFAVFEIITLQRKYFSGNNLDPGPIPPKLEVQCKCTCMLSVVLIFIEIVVMKMFALRFAYS